MQVGSIIGYPSYEAAGLRFDSSDWIAHNLVKALKGKDFRGYSDVRLSGVQHRITHANRRPVVDFFGRVIAKHVARMEAGSAIFIVPSSQCLEYGHDPKAQSFVDAITRAGCESPIFMPFRWTENLQRAVDGGIRNAQFLAGRLDFAPPPGVRTALLVDDVVTTGGHLRACSAVVREGNISVRNAICFARTVWERPENILQATSHIIED